MPQAKPKVIVTRRWPAVVERELAARFDVELNDSDGPLAAAALRDALTRADALCPTVSDRIDAAALDHDDLRARVLANFGAGFNHIDLDAARKRQLGRLSRF